jgi:hypothetical protein
VVGLRNILGEINYGEVHYRKAVSVIGGIVLPLQVAHEMVSLAFSNKEHPGLVCVIDLGNPPGHYARFSKREETKVIGRSFQGIGESMVFVEPRVLS